MMCPWISTSSTNPCLPTLAGTMTASFAVALFLDGVLVPLFRVRCGARRGTEPVAGRASAAEDLGQHLLGPVGQGAGPDRGDGILDRVLDAAQLDLSVLDHSVGGPGVAVARLADAARVDD